MVCLDTDFLIAFLRSEPRAIRRLQELQIGGEETAVTTTVNVAELWKGVYHSLARANGQGRKGMDGNQEKTQDRSKVERLLATLELITLDSNSARLVGELDATLRSTPIGDLDLLIACIALASDQAILTRNRKHFERIPGLKVHSW